MKTNLKTTTKWILSLVAAGVLALAGADRAQAQTNTTVGSTSNASGGAGLGFGAAAFLRGLGSAGAPAGALVAYDMPVWHIEGILGFDSRDTGAPNDQTVTTFGVGVRGWYHLKQGVNSDFSLGGGIGFNHRSVSNGGSSGTETALEPGFQARVFLTPNFVLFGVGGFSIDFGDAVDDRSGVGFGGHLTGNFGFTYYFRS